jgi:hypothetical protein
MSCGSTTCTSHDVGLSREHAVEEACKSPWIGVTMWRIQR